MPANFSREDCPVTFLDGGEFARLEPHSLTFTDANGTVWTAPAGTLTDGASVPRVALIISNGRFQKEILRAAIVHDAYCQTDNAERAPPYRSRPWRDVHRMFYEACIAGGTSRATASLMYAGVCYFGPKWDDPKSEKAQPPAALAHLAFSGTKHWIEHADPTATPEPDDIDADVIRREAEIMVINDMQLRALKLMREGEAGRMSAEAILDKTRNMILAKLQESKNDLMYRNLEGYQYKNRALLFRHTPFSDPRNFDNAVRAAHDVFRFVLSKDDGDPSALNGLGSVALLCEDIPAARHYIQAALDVLPNYPAAQNDLKLVEWYESQSKKPN